MDRSNKTVLITGGGTGIGEAVARVLASEGNNVVLMGRRFDRTQGVVASLGSHAMAAAGDAAVSQDVRSVLESLNARFGGLDAVVACAGVMGAGAVGQTDDQSWSAVMHGNLTSAFVTARETLPALIKSKGAIVVVSSIGGLEAVPQACAYTVAKHAVLGLVRSLALDYGPVGVRTNAVCPGWVSTPMADGHMQIVMDRENVSLEEAYAIMSANTPLKRPATPKEVANVCSFLISEKSSAMSGSVVTVDGGSTVVCAPMLNLLK
jgi:NAD(P)-dependent dehydrogenase (short-subunit alcohol dehydrogenase family)